MKKSFACVFLMMFLITGCADAEQVIERTVSDIQRAAETIAAEGVSEQEASDAGAAAESEAGESIQKMMDGQTGKYAFDSLSQEKRILYAQILKTLQDRASDVEISTEDTGEIEEVFQCVMNDHPEIFYVDGYTYTKHTLGEELQKISFSGSYVYETEDILQKQMEIDGYVQRVLRGIPAGADEYEVVKYVYEYVVEHTEYNLAARDNQNICSVFLNGESVCQGYAKATQYLLERAGLFATLVTGTVETGEGHAWNLVRIDGEYYYVDTTWGDASYVMNEAQAGYEGRVPTINYDYLCVTTEQIEKTHTIGGVTAMPECTSMDSNYYVREDSYFTDMDADKLSGLFKKAYESGGEYVTIKCASEELYGLMEQELIFEQKVFEYMDTREGKVAYTNNREQLCLSFWL